MEQEKGHQIGEVLRGTRGQGQWNQREEEGEASLVQLGARN